MSVATFPRVRNKDQIMAWANRQKAAPLSAAQAAAMDSVYPDWRKTLNGVWFTNLEAVEGFVAANGFFPRAGVAESAEKAIGVWLATQRYRAGLLSADRLALLDERLPGWNKSKDEVWNERLDEVCAIAAALGRVPTTNEKDAEARRAGIWLRRHAKSPETDPKVLTLNERIPGWNDRTFDSIWRSRMDALEAFVTTHDRFPTQHEKDREDRRLGVWLHARRHDGERLPVERREEMNRRTPGWDRTADDKWAITLDFAAAHLVEHGKLPSEHSDDPAVAAAGRWIGTQRRSSLPPHRSDALDARLPGWRNRLGNKWDSMLDYVASFSAEHGRLPSSAASAGPQERQAAAWVQRQRKGTGLTPERRARLDSRVPGWCETAESVWFRRLDECVAFYNAQARRPRASSADEAERKLGIWLSNANAGRLSADRAAALAAAAVGGLRSFDQIWSDTLDQVSAFRGEHGRFPTASGNCQGERPLATWLAHQRAIKGKMSPERRKLMAASIPGWDITQKDLWPMRLQACVDFLHANGRLPSTGKSASEAEKKLAAWILDQRKSKSASRAERDALLDDQLPGWRGTAAG